MLDGHTFAEFYTIWCGGAGAGQPGGNDPERRRAQINRRRAELGLPPMKPAPAPARAAKR